MEDGFVFDRGIKVFPGEAEGFNLHKSNIFSLKDCPTRKILGMIIINRNNHSYFLTYPSDFNRSRRRVASMRYT